VHAPRRILTSGGALCLLAGLGTALSACSGQGPPVTSQSAPGHSSAASAAGLASAGPVQLGKVVFNGNFSDPSQQWPAQAAAIPKPFVSGATPSLTLNGSTYTVQLNGPGSVAPLPDFRATPPIDLVNVAVSSTVQPGSVSAGDAVGVVCRAISGHAYVFSVGPGDHSGALNWSIFVQGGQSRPLASGTVAAPTQPALTIEGDCIGGAQQSPRQLVASLDGQVIGRATDTQVSAPYAGRAGLWVSSDHGGTSATFSSFQVRAASVS